MKGLERMERWVGKERFGEVKKRDEQKSIREIKIS